jgi:hypothetical protein
MLDKAFLYPANQVFGNSKFVKTDWLHLARVTVSIKFPVGNRKRVPLGSDEKIIERLAFRKPRTKNTQIATTAQNERLILILFSCLGTEPRRVHPPR